MIATTVWNIYIFFRIKLHLIQSAISWKLECCSTNLSRSFHLLPQFYFWQRRNGTELRPIFKDDNYDFNYQEGRVLLHERVVEKGDVLFTKCDYRTVNKKTVTLVIYKFEVFDIATIITSPYNLNVHTIVTNLKGVPFEDFANLRKLC